MAGRGTGWTFRHNVHCTASPTFDYLLQFTEYLRSDILMSTPVDLFRFSSCDTTTCSSFVRWQSSSNMSVPILTALQQESKLEKCSLLDLTNTSVKRLHLVKLDWKHFTNAMQFILMTYLRQISTILSFFFSREMLRHNLCKAAHRVSIKSWAWNPRVPGSCVSYPFSASNVHVSPC